MRKYLKNVLAVKLLLSMTIVTALIMVMAAIILHFSFREQQEDRYRQLVNNTMTNIDTVFSGYVENTRNAGIQWYESSDGKLCRFAQDYRMPEHMSFIYRVRDAMTYTPYIQSVFLINKYREVSFYVGSGSAFIEKEKQTLVKKIESEENSIFFWRAPNHVSNGKDVALLTVLYPNARIESDSFEGIVGINIDARNMSRRLFGEEDKELMICIMDQSGKIVAHSDENYCGESLKETELAERIWKGDNQFETKFSGERYEINWIPSAQDGFYIVGFVDFGSEKERLLVIPVQLLTFLLIVIITGTVFKVILNPLTSIILEMRMVGYVNELEDDEVVFLQQYHKNMVKQLEDFHIKEEKNTAVKNLLSGNSDKIVWELFRQHYKIEMGVSYCLFQLYFMGVMEEKDGLSIYEQQKNLVRSICMEALTWEQGYKCIDFDVSLRSILLIVYRENEQIEELTDLYGKIVEKQSEIEDAYGETIIVAGSSCAAWEDSNIAQRYQLLRSRVKTERILEQKKGLIISEQEETQSSNKGYIREIIKMVRQRDHQGYRNRLNLMLEANKGVSYEKLISTLLEVHGEICQTMKEIASEKNIDIKNEEVRNQIMRISNRKELMEWFDSLYERSDSDGGTISQHGISNLMAEAVDHIQKNYGEYSLSVQFLAARADLSIQYFSKRFKEFTGYSVLEYITKVRMESARDMLVLNYHMDIADIAEQTGYGNSAYFSKVFKKYYGVSPARYRDYQKSMKH